MTNMAGVQHEAHQQSTSQLVHSQPTSQVVHHRRRHHPAQLERVGGQHDHEGHAQHHRGDGGGSAVFVFLEPNIDQQRGDLGLAGLHHQPARQALVHLFQVFGGAGVVVVAMGQAGSVQRTDNVRWQVPAMPLPTGFGQRLCAQHTVCNLLTAETVSET